MLDKEMLLGAIKNDQDALSQSLEDISKQGKILGKLEIISQLITVFESGKFDYFSKEKSQEKTVQQMDAAVENILPEIDNSSGQIDQCQYCKNI